MRVRSLFGLLAVPSQGTYNASKFAVRGFTESLRQELDFDCFQIQLLLLVDREGRLIRGHRHR